MRLADLLCVHGVCWCAGPAAVGLPWHVTSHATKRGICDAQPVAAGLSLDGTPVQRGLWLTGALVAGLGVQSFKSLESGRSTDAAV